MPITGVFRADFTDFLAAVQKAETKLVDFQTGASKVEQSLNRMVDAFGGRRIIQDATLMTEAVTRIGGAAKLTEGEQARVNRTVTEAIAKYAVLGKDAPASMIALAEATKRVEAPTAALGTSMIALGTFIGTMATQAVTALARLAADGVEKLVAGLGDLIVQGAGVADVTENFTRLTAQVGLLGGTVLAKLREGTHGTITDFELMKSVNQGLAAGMTLTTAQMSALAKGAFALAQATGGDVKTAYDAMNDAMLTGRTRAVALLTGKIDLEAAELKYAAALGILRKDLTDTQKLEAARAGILDSVTAATVRLGVQTDGLDEKLAQATTWWENLKLKLGEVLATSPVLNAALDSIGKSVREAFGTNQDVAVGALAKRITDLSVTLVDLASVGVSTAKYIAEGFYLLRGVLFGVLESVVNIVTTMLNATARLNEMAAAIPGIGGAWKGVAIDARAAADQVGAIAASFKTTKEAAFDAMGTSGAAFDSANEKLARMRAAMAAAANQPIIPPAAIAAVTDLAAKVPTVTAAVTAAAAAQEVYNTGLKITSGVIGVLIPQLRDLAGEETTAAEQKKKREGGGSKEFNFQTEQGRAQLEIDDPILAKFLHLGYSLAQAAQLKLGQLYGFEPKIAQKGPRVPGFAEGGTVMVGEHGAEAVRLPFGSQVFPHDGSGAGGGITVTVAAGAVVITNPILRDRQALDQIGQIVSDAITQRLAASGHRLGGR